MPIMNPKIRAFGIDLSDLSVKIIKLDQKRKGLVLASFGREEIKPGLIEDGEIKQEGELIETIKKALKETRGGRLNSDFCTASLPEKLSFVQVVKLPQMKNEEVAEAIKWELEARIPLTRDEIYYDWQVLGESPKGGIDVLLGVLPKKTVDPYLDVLKKAGLKPMAFEIESIATARALMKNGVSSEPVLILDLGAKKTSLLIFYGQAVYFTTSLPISNDFLVSNLSEQLKIEKEKAKEIKFKVGINFKNQTSQIYKIMEAPLFDMCEKIKSYIEYYNDHIMPQQTGKKISQVVLCGGGAVMEGLPEFLSSRLSMNVKVGNPWVNLIEGDGLSADMPLGESLAYSTAIGLALRDYD